MGNEVLFSIQTKTERLTGQAIVVDTYSEGKEKALDFFNGFIEGDFETNKIGSFDGYSIYENYIDSGSIDYFFFAIQI